MVKQCLTHLYTCYYRSVPIVPESTEAQTLSSAERAALEAERKFKEELRLYEMFAIRGFTWLLPYLKTEVASESFKNDVESFTDNPTPELAEHFLSWVAEISQLISGLLVLLRAPLAADKTPQTPQTLEELRQEKLEEYMHSHSLILDFLRKHEQVAVFARVVSKPTVPLDTLESQYRIHFLELFAHDIQGSRMLMILNSALEYLLEDFEENTVAGIAAMVSEKLQGIPKVLERHSFDTEVTAELRGSELVGQIKSIITETQVNFPQLRIVVEQSWNDINLTNDVYGITQDMLKLLVDNCAANSLKAGASEVTCEFIRKGGWLYIAFSDNGPGFSSKHTFEQSREVAPGYVLAPVAIEKGKSIWEGSGVMGTGIGLAELKSYLAESEGSLLAGNRMVGNEKAGGAVVAVVSAARLRA